jgi:aminoglycoside phosphotransferase (APT) family kinase protein
VNAIYRIGSRLCARLPRLEQWAGAIEREWQWLPRLAPALTIRIPEPVWLGRPGAGYPFSWAVYRWIEGHRYDSRLVDEREAASDLARFARELHAFGPGPGAPAAGRLPLRDLDATTRAAIDAAAGVISGPAARAAWEAALESPPWDGTGGWIHSDLLPPNLLVSGGRICAVLDFGGAGVGDPATDVIPAWSVFGPAGRRAFRDALEVDEGTWGRARGLALHQAAGLIAYYARSNPAYTALGVRTVEQVLADAADSS